ncbi:MAG: phosphotransferase [Chloroflexota bacterium]|nr:phosphotransferase [Chloroflexota bacterium]
MKGLVPIVEGFSSSVFKTEDGACLKVARSAEAASRLRHAFAVSAAIAPFVDVAVPQAVRWLPATEAQPHGGVLCAWMDGAQLSAAADPGPVAAFLRDLHAVDPTVLRSIVAPYGRWRVQQIDRARRGLAAASALIGPEMTRWVGRVLGDLADDLQRLPGPAVVHGDVWRENMLCARFALTAVLEWEAAAIGDPAVDLAGLWHLGDDWARGVLDALGPPLSERRRCQAWRLARARGRRLVDAPRR